MVNDVAVAFGANVVRTAVGEANVVAGMKASGAIIGGEGNGGVILPEVCWVRDSLTAMALILDLIVSRMNEPTHSSRVSLSAIIKELPHYVMLKRTFDLQPLGGSAAVAPALDRVIRQFATAKLNSTDGVRLDFDDGWVHLRPSNTEPIIRLIAEAKTEARTLELINQVAASAGLR
jgi:phosphomannomutase